jgi:hypothetical protein
MVNVERPSTFRGSLPVPGAPSAFTVGLCLSGQVNEEAKRFPLTAMRAPSAVGDARNRTNGLVAESRYVVRAGSRCKPRVASRSGPALAKEDRTAKTAVTVVYLLSEAPLGAERSS